MALIDRDVTLERMKSMAGCATCDNYNYVRCRACIWDDAMNIVEEMSEVEAVPVEWLQRRRDIYLKAYHAGHESEIHTAAILNDTLRAWQKEQEAKT